MLTSRNLWSIEVGIGAGTEKDRLPVATLASIPIPIVGLSLEKEIFRKRVIFLKDKASPPVMVIGEVDHLISIVATIV